MKKVIVVFVLLMVFVLLPSSVSATGNEYILKKMIKTLKAETGQIVSRDQIVVFTSEKEARDRFADKKEAANIAVLTGSEMFVENSSFPIYINAWSPLWDAARRSSDEAYTVVLASILAHEVVHATGESDERVAHEFELKILENFERKCRDCNKTIIDGVISQTKTLLASYR